MKNNKNKSPIQLQTRRLKYFHHYKKKKKILIKSQKEKDSQGKHMMEMKITRNCDCSLFLFPVNEALRGQGHIPIIHW